MPVRITKPITLNQIATAAGLPNNESMKSIAGSLVGSLIAGVYPPVSTRADHNMSEYLYSWTDVENQRVIADGSEFLISDHGQTVVVSGDGNTMAEVSLLDNNRLGAIRVWVWNGSAWVQQARLVSPYTIDQYIAADSYMPSFANFAEALSISSDGNTIMASSGYTPNGDRLLFVYSRSGSAWTMSSQILLPSSAYFSAFNIVMTSDAQLIFIGDYQKIYVYARSGNSWSQLNVFNADALSSADAISASSNGQYVSARQYNGGSTTDTVNIYSRSGNTWVLQSTVTPVNVLMGQRHCLNSTGTVLVAQTQNVNGAQYLSFYTRSGTVWTERQNTSYPQVIDQILLNSTGTIVAVAGAQYSSNTNTTNYISVWASNDLLTWYLGQALPQSTITPAAYGQSIGISADATRIAVGLPGTPLDRLGKVVMYHYNGTSFVKQGGDLVGTGDTTNGASIGGAIALTADGNRMFTISPGVGKVLIYDKNVAGQWVRSSETLGPPSGFIFTGSKYFWGNDLAASADGSTVVVGSSNDNGDIGAAWVFMKNSSGVWSNIQKITGTGYTGTPQFGCSVAISAAGDTIVVGGFSDNNYVGAFWIFTRSTNTWTQVGSKIIPSDRAIPPASSSNYVNNRIGASVAISADGNTIAIGAPYESLNSGYTVVYNGQTVPLYRQIGATWVYTRNGSTWTQQGSKIIGTGYYAPGNNNYWDGNIYQGSSVSLSADGSTLAVGAIGDGVVIDGWFLNPWREGAVWVFTRSGSTWTQQGSKLAISGATSNLGLGNSVSLSASGNVLAVGGSNYMKDFFLTRLGLGAGVVFTRENGVWTNQTGIIQGSNIKFMFWQLDKYGFGYKVAASASGRTILFGGPGGDSGAIWDYK